MGDLIIAGQPFKIDAPVVNWFQSGWSAIVERCIPVPGHPEGNSCIGAYSPRAKNKFPKRYATRPRLRKYGMRPPLEAVKALVRKFVLHHDGCADAKMCWHVLHNERGLSCHFIIDNDGTIYQTLDLALMGFHAGEGHNQDSIGVEFCNRGDAKEFPNYYAKKGGRPTTHCKINGHTIFSYDFTDAQYRVFHELGRALRRLLPNIPVEYPQDPAAPGQQFWGTIPGGGAHGFAGYIGHYHLTQRKWDPGPFDIRKFCQQLRGAFCFPLFTTDDAKRAKDARPEIPDAVDELRDRAKELIDLNESSADGGFFPIGPWGEARLWHGGIHLTGKEGQALYAPLPGRIVAARMGGDSAVGSTNFVLVRHELALGAQPMQFFSLYMHLADESKVAPAQQPDWMTKGNWAKIGQPGKVTLLDEPVQAGALFAHMGSAGPPDLRRPQLHFEIFSEDPLFDKIPGAQWEYIDGATSGRYCTDEKITKNIDTNKDQRLSREEMTSFYRAGSAQQFHLMMTYHVSEWTFEPDWHEALRSQADYRSFKPKELDQMIDEQITPLLWWNDEVAAHAGLPSSGEVVHYHPVKFLEFFNQKIVEASGTVAAIDPTKAAKATSVGMVDDFGDVAGEHALSEVDEDDDRCDKALDLKEMVQGFDAPLPPGCAE